MDVVVSLDFPPDVGGAHLWLYEVYRRWPRDVSVFTRQLPANPAAAERTRKFDAAHSGSFRIHRDASSCGHINLLDVRYLWETLTQARRVARLARSDGQVPRLHALRAFPEGFIALLAKKIFLHEAILITYAHGEEILVAVTSRQLNAIARWVYGSSNAIIANSANTEKLLREVSPKAQVIRIHPGVRASDFVGDEDAARTSVRARFGWPQDSFVLFSVSRMEARKNQATVIRAIAALREKGYDIRYLCAGTGETRGDLESLSTVLGMEGSVAFPGQISDPEKRECLLGADAHIMVSIQHEAMIEGFGIVFMEAAAAGLPSIAGSAGGQPEAVLDGATGLVVDGRSLQEVTLAILTLASDKGFRAELGLAARAWAAEHDWDRVVERTIAGLAQIGVTVT